MHVIITGGSSGIGAAVAELEAARVARISMIASRDRTGAALALRPENCRVGQAFRPLTGLPCKVL